MREPSNPNRSAPSEADDEKYDNEREYKDQSTDADDADDDADDEPLPSSSSWRTLGMSRLFGGGAKKAAPRRKAPRSSAGAGHGGEEEHEMDSSINTRAAGPAAEPPPRDHRPRHHRPARQRAKVAVYPVKSLDVDNSESDYHTDRGLEPLDASMEATVLPQRRHPPHARKSHHHAPRRPDPPDAAAATPARPARPPPRRRRTGRGGADGYENSGHETSDCCLFTEDDKSDFYLATEDDRERDGPDERDGPAGGGAADAGGTPSPKLTLKKPRGRRKPKAKKGAAPPTVPEDLPNVAVPEGEDSAPAKAAAPRNSSGSRSGPPRR